MTPVNAGRRDDHHRQQEGRANRTSQPKHDQQPADDLTQRGSCREEPPRPKTDLFEERPRAVQTVTAEPAEELLRTVSRHQGPEHHTQQKKTNCHHAPPDKSIVTILNIVTIYEEAA